MLATAATVREVAELAAEGRLPHLVVDPVLVSSSGHPLLEPAGVEAYLEDLLPRALVATPNLREAAVLSGTDPEDLRTPRPGWRWPRCLRAGGARFVVVKGGHLADSADDVVAGPDGVLVLPAPRVPTTNDHGTGCSFSAAVVAHLARGPAVPEALQQAKDFVTRALAGAPSWRLGAGHGPLDHFGWSGRP